MKEVAITNIAEVQTSRIVTVRQDFDISLSSLIA
jgi:hypothetical protein|tara:strand:- start:2943 stop:3044 length:102 start_codon:yes stop_codon:yes gene_type:complete